MEERRPPLLLLHGLAHNNGGHASEWVPVWLGGTMPGTTRPKDPTAIDPTAAVVYRLRYLVMYELRLLKEKCPSGVFVIPSQASELQWDGIIFLSSGPLAGAMVRFLLKIPMDFPQSAPTILITDSLWHPQVDERTSQVNIQGLMQGPDKAWRPNHDHVYHVLEMMKYLLVVCPTERAVNVAAAEMKVKKFADFKLLCERQVRDSEERMRREIGETDMDLGNHVGTVTVPSKIQFRGFDQDMQRFGEDFIGKTYEDHGAEPGWSSGNLLYGGNPEGGSVGKVTSFVKSLGRSFFS
eukprot:Clim_evm14s60 gene=Clim_evmTU14s60